MARRKRRTREQRLSDIEARITELQPLVRALRRFTPDAVLSHRERVGCTATQYASLLGVSPRVVYNWEAGLSRPKPEQLLRWVELKQGRVGAIRERLGMLPPMNPAHVRSARRHLGLSQEWFAVLLGVNQGLVSRWEAGTIRVTPVNALRVEAARALSKAKAAAMVERGHVVRPSRAPRQQRPAQRLRGTRRLPLDPEAELAALKQQAADLREEIKARRGSSPEAVRRHRAALGLSAREYGEMLGVSTQAVYGWERGEFVPTGAAMSRWLDAASARPTVPPRLAPGRAERRA